MARTGKAFFVSGTDTEIGKTFIASALLSKARDRGLSTLGLKPIAAGCERLDGELRNDDALQLMAASTVQLPYEVVNPIALEPPIAPHVAAEKVGVRLSVLELGKSIAKGTSHAADLTLIEGAGGLMVPLNDRELFIDLCGLLKLDVIFVVGLKLGCINHAILSVEAMQRRNIEIAGWIGNSPHEIMDEHEANVGALIKRIPAPCLGIVPPLGNSTNPVESATEHLELDQLLA